MGTTVSALRETLELIVGHLVDDPSAVEISIEDGDDEVVFEVRCPAGDVGKLVGKSGRNIQAVRTLMAAVGAKHQRRVRVEIIEPDVPA